MGAALALAGRTRSRTAPNPNVGCVIVTSGHVAGRGWTKAGGRPHAEAMALSQAGDAAHGATAYVTLEPCAHASPRGPACADLLIAAKVARVVVALADPDPRTNGMGIARLRAAGIVVTEGIEADAARRSMAGFLTRRAFGRPHATLKLALSLDGCIAAADGSSRWITGHDARAHAHLERAQHEAIVVGRETYEADGPRLDVRLPGLEDRAPDRYILSSRAEFAPSAEQTNWNILGSVEGISKIRGDHIFVEGGAGTAAAFLKADLIDRLLLYTAPILIGAGKPAIANIGLTDLAETHGRWRAVDSRRLGSDRLDVYERTRCLPA